MLRIPKSLGSDTFRAVYDGLPGPNRKLANQLDRTKKSKKFLKIDFFKEVQNGFQRSQPTPRVIADTPYDLWSPFLTLPKNRFSKKNFEIFSIFRDFWSVGVGLLIFDFGPADPHRLPGVCPTHNFTNSWASGEHLRTLVCPHRATSRPVPPPYPRSAEHRLRCFFLTLRPQNR